MAFAFLLLVASASVTLVTRAPGRAGAASTAGYWLMATDGGVFSFGKAAFHGSTGNIPLNQPIVGTASTPTGRGYWLVAADGGIFTFGDAGFHGSMGGTKLNKPVVDMAATPSGRGYRLAATDGGIFAFGDAGFFGSTGSIDLAKRIHALSVTPSGRGYWLVAGGGGIFAFGDASFHGSAAGGDAEKRVIDMAPSASGKGYYATTSEGQVLAYGDATFHGDTKEIKLNHRIVAMAAMNANEPPVAVDDLVSLDEDGVITINVLANDRDPDGGPLALRGISAAPQRGTATVVGNAVVYRSLPDFNGTDSFTYTLADDRAATAVGRVIVTVRAVDDKPHAVDDTALTQERRPAVVPVLANDAGLGDGVRSVSVTSGPSHGSAIVNPDRTVTYTPDDDYTGTDGFEYKVTDVDGDSSTARVRLEVVAVNDIPVARDDIVSTPAGRSLRDIDVTANDSSPDGFRRILPVDPNGNPIDTDDPLSTELGGTFERDDDTFNYFPPRGVTGTDTFRYVIVDGQRDGDPHGGDLSNIATVRVNLGINGAPRILRDAAFSVDQGATVTCERVEECLAQVVEDSEGDRLTFKLRRAPTANIDLHANGTFTYGPAGAPPGDSFTFVADDGNQESQEGTVNISISPAPQPQSGPPTTAGALLAPWGPVAAASAFARRRRASRP